MTLASPRLRSYFEGVTRYLWFLAVGLLVAGCATSSVESRRKEKGSVYSGLSTEMKALVDQGRIKVGMPMDAVYIAWGKPAQVLHNETAGGASTVWLYEGAWLEESRSWAHRWVGSGPRAHVEPYATLDYIPRSYVSAEVIFVDGVVREWRTLPSPVY